MATLDFKGFPVFSYRKKQFKRNRIIFFYNAFIQQHAIVIKDFKNKEFDNEFRDFKDF